MFKKILFYVSLICLTFPVAGAADGLKDLNLVTEFYPPYNYEEDGQIKGISVDILIRAMQEAGADVQPSDIELKQWSKGYDQALNQAGTLLFATTRTKEREDLFKWAGPIAPTKISLVAKKDGDAKIDSLSDIAAKGYKVGVVKDDIGHQILKQNGVPDSCLVVRPFPGLNFMELYKGEIDAWAYEENVAMWICGVYGFKSSDYVPVHTLQEAELYYSFNKEVSDSTISKLQKALEKVRSAGGFKEIMQKYR